jgi:radical SAM protein with 4Fe4S-binding SPASM domain
MRFILLKIYVAVIRIIVLLTGNKALKIQAYRNTFFKKQICFAAQNNMFFSPSGKIYPCCFNRKDVVGDVHASEKQWFETKERAHLQNKLKKNDFSEGCAFCKEAIHAGNYVATGSLAYDSWSKNTHEPKSMEFETDTICNLQCVMCPDEFHTTKSHSVYPPNFHETLKPWIKNLKWAKFYGGEPFIVPDYYRIWDHLISENPDCIIKVQTNGTILNERIKALLTKGKFWFMISLDSLRPEVYQKIRIGADFEKWKSNFHYFLNYSRQNKFPLNIAVCPMTLNASEMLDMVEFCNEHHIHINFNLLTSPSSLSIKNLPSAKIQLLIDQFLNSKFRTNTYVRYQNIRHFKSLIHQLQVWHKEALESEQSPMLEYDANDFCRHLFGQLPEEEMQNAEKKLRMVLSGRKIKIRENQFEKLKVVHPGKLSAFIETSSSEEILNRLDEYAVIITD